MENNELSADDPASTNFFRDGDDEVIVTVDSNNTDEACDDDYFDDLKTVQAKVHKDDNFMQEQEC